MIEGTRCLGDKTESPEFALDDLVVLREVLLDDGFLESSDEQGILTLGYTCYCFVCVCTFVGIPFLGEKKRSDWEEKTPHKI